MIDFETKKVLFIDLDSTLIKTISGKTFPEDITDFRIQLPVLDKIIEKIPNLNSFYIVTNQGGVGTYYTKEDIETKLRTIEVFCQRYLDTHYNLPDDEFVMTGYQYCDSMDKTNHRRKPNTGMLEWLIEGYKELQKSQILMIGDASGKPGDFSDSDKKCAENFGIDYIDVRDFLEL